MLDFFNSNWLLVVAYFSQYIPSKEIMHTIKPPPVQPEVCVCVRARERACLHNDTVDCSDYTTVYLTPRKSDVKANSRSDYITSLQILFKNKSPFNHIVKQYQFINFQI
jgi:hypothetical protein